MIISRVAIRRPIFTSMVLGAMVVFGILALMRLGVDQFPKVDFPVITIVTKLPGADPETMEMRVSDPIEEAVNTISGLKSLRSTSADSYSMVVVEFELEKNVDVAFQEIQSNINAIRQQLPKDVDEPVIQKFDIDAAPILTVVVSADMGTRELSYLADKTIRERLQRVRNVGSVRVIGKRERKIWLWLDADQMKSHGITVQEVRDALQRGHVEVPGGRVETGRVELAVRTKAEYSDAEELNALVVVQRDGRTIRLRDIGFAEDGLEEERSYAMLDGKPCIALDVRRQSGTNTVEVAKEVKAEIAVLEQELSSRNVKLVIAKDSSLYIERSVKEVEHHLVIGGLMAILTVLVFLLNTRSTLISALALPTSVLSTFLLMQAMGFTLNMMTLLALTLAIGLLIDDAIVVQENIMRHVEEGMPPREAADFGTAEIGLAVLATTLSIVAVFIPVAMTKGIVGRFFWPFGLTIAFAVMISMFVSFTLSPMLSARMLRPHAGHQNRLFAGLDAFFTRIEKFYGTLLDWSLGHRVLVLMIAVAALFSTVFLLKFSKTEFVPVEDSNQFNVMIRGPQGASLAETRAIIDRLTPQIRQSVPEIAYTFASIGADEMQKVQEGTIYCKLVDKSQRKDSQTVLMDRLRQEVTSKVTDAQVSVQAVATVSGGGMKWAQIQYEVRGQDIAVLQDTVAKIMERMEKAGGFVDLQSSYEANKPGVDVVVDRARASEFGVSELAIADTVRTAVGGSVVGKFKAGGDRYDIGMRFLEKDRNRPDLINDLWVPSSRGGKVELRNVAKVVDAKTAVEITRYNRQRDITILANLGEMPLPPGADPKAKREVRVLGPSKIEIAKITKDVGLPTGYSTGYTGQGKDMEESFFNLIITMILSIIVIYMVLAAQFESLVHPFSIMLSLPLAIVGGLGAIILFRCPISIFVMISFIFLFGLVTKNAILLIDYTNTLRERDGLPMMEALRKAGPVRLRPILMTTMAVITGMLPTALSTAAGSESRQPMAISIIGGLVTSTLLTLLVVPAVYSLLDPISEWMKRSFIDRKD